ncbi:hypothetical protein D3C71_1393500 [compost metagenome]
MPPEYAGADHHQRQLDGDKHAKLRITPVHFQAAPAQQGKVQAVVTTGDQQENSNNGVDGGTGVVTDAGIVGREAANGDGREAMAYGVEHRHAGPPERQRAGNGQQNINQPQGFSRFGNARAHFVIFQRARHFSPVQLHPPDTEDRQYRYGQHNDPHPAHPLQHLPIEQDGFG